MKKVRSAHGFEWDLLQNSFDSGIIYRPRETSQKNNLTYFTWCSTPTHQH